MENNEILQAVNEIFKEELDNEEIVLTPESVADDVEEWNSLSHVFLMVAVEKHFKIRFTSKEIQSFTNVGALCQCIQQKLNGAA
jgi:acyl carrier protein